MNAPMDNLRSGLADLAAEVQPTDLRDRALRTSRRIGLRRTAVTSALSMVLLGGAGVVAVAATGGGGSPVDPTATATASGPAASPSTPPVRPVQSNAYYFLWQREPKTMELRVLYETYSCERSDPCTPATRVEVLRTFKPPADEPCPRNSISVSPDGRRFAWVVAAGDPSGISGDLMVADTRGGTPEKRGTKVLCGGSRALVWTPDSTRLYVGKLSDAAEVGVVDASTGKFTPMERTAWQEAETSATGPYRGTVHDGRLTVVKADGTAPRSVPYQDPYGMDAMVIGVSHDGRYAVVSVGVGDPSRQLIPAAVIDMSTGQPIRIPLDMTLERAWFHPDGSMVVGAQGALYHLDAEFRVVAKTELDPALLPNGMPFQVVFG